MDEFPNLSEEDINQLMSRDEDELYILVGQNVPVIVDGRYIQPSSEQALAWGKDIYRKIKDKLRQKICVEMDYCNRRSDPLFGDLNGIAIIILPFLPHGVGILAAYGIAAILLKRGLNKFCNCER